MEKEEAMKILKEFHDKSALFSVRTALDTVIPELKESKDEKIKEDIYSLIKINTTRELANKYIAWLEKQKPSNELQEYKRKLEKSITESILFYRNSEHNTKETRNSDLGAIGALINLKVSLGVSLFRWERLMYEGKCLPF